MLNVFLVIPLIGGAAQADASRSVQELVTANQAAIECIRQIDTRIEVYGTVWRGKHIDKPMHFATWRWSKNLDEERQRYEQYLGYEPSADGNPQNLGDLIETGDRRRVLLNWDPLKPQRITPHRQGTVRAWFEPPSPNLTSPFPNPAASFALFQIQANLSDARQTLAQLVAASPSVEVSQLTEDGNKKVWQLTIQHPDNKNNGVFAKSSYKIVLDPSVNYLVTKVVAYIADTDPSPANTVPIRTERKIIDFGQTEDGSYFPKRVVARMYDGREPSDAPPALEQDLIANDLIVNGALPNDALNFAFPENAVVYEMPAVNGSYPLHIWGSDDKPVRTYTGDYREFRFPDPKELAQELSAPSRGYFKQVLIAVNVAIVVAILILLYKRRWRAREG